MSQEVPRPRAYLDVVKSALAASGATAAALAPITGLPVPPLFEGGAQPTAVVAPIPSEVHSPSGGLTPATLEGVTPRTYLETIRTALAATGVAAVAHVGALLVPTVPTGGSQTVGGVESLTPSTVGVVEDADPTAPGGVVPETHLPAQSGSGAAPALALTAVVAQADPGIQGLEPNSVPIIPERVAAVVGDSDTASGYYEGDSSDDDDEDVPQPAVDTDTGSGWFSAGAWAKMHAHLGAHSTTELTKDGYQRSLKLWSQFLGSLPPSHRPGSLLLAVTCSTDKARFVVLYTIFLYEEHELRDEALYAHLTALRYHFEVNLQSTTFLGEGVIKRARKAAGFTTGEAKLAIIRRTLTAMLPFILSMANEIQARCWDDLGWATSEDLDKRVVHLAIHLSLDCGNRISNVTAPDGKKANDHGIKAGSVVAIVKEYGDSLEERIAGGPALYAHMLLHRTHPLPGSVREFATAFPQVTGFELTHYTTKTTRGSKITSAKPVLLLRRSAQESRLVDQLCEWFDHAPRLTAEDHLLCRYPPQGTGKGRQPRRKEIVAAIKACAQALRYDPTRFFSKSLRVGFATYANANGVGADARNYRAGWSAGSAVPDAYYAKNVDCGGVLAWEGAAETEGGRFGEQQLQNMSAVTRTAVAHPTSVKAPKAARIVKVSKGTTVAKVPKGKVTAKGVKRAVVHKTPAPPLVAAAPIRTASGRVSKAAQPF
jgi:hypothetical protein